MPLDIPAHAPCFIDANIFVYHFIELGAISSECRSFLGRVAQSQVIAFTTTFCMADAMHRVMAIEAQQQFKPSSGAVAWLQRNPDRISELSAFHEAASQMAALPLRLLTADSRTLLDAADLSIQYGLLTNDAIIVALMRQYQIIHLASNDDDFDKISGIKIYKPR